MHLSVNQENWIYIDIQINLFDILVVPILLYGCEISGFENNDIVGKNPLKILQNNSQHKQNNSFMHGIWWTRMISS